MIVVPFLKTLDFNIKWFLKFKSLCSCNVLFLGSSPVLANFQIQYLQIFECQLIFSSFVHSGVWCVMVAVGLLKTILQTWVGSEQCARFVFSYF